MEERGWGGGVKPKGSFRKWGAFLKLIHIDMRLGE